MAKVMPQQMLSDRPRHPPTIVQVMEPTEEKEQGDQHPGILVCSGLRSFLEVGLSVPPEIGTSKGLRLGAVGPMGTL